jgi:cytoskeletal protein CcmA (bactofilin family)
MFKKESHMESPPVGEKGTTIIGNGASFNGVLKINGSLRVDGEVEGQVQVSEDLTIGATGVLRADITSKSAFVSGRIKGSISAQGTVELKRGSRLEGDVHATSFKIEDGAFFQGNCAMGEAAVRTQGKAKASLDASAADQKLKIMTN